MRGTLCESDLQLKVERESVDSKISGKIFALVSSEWGALWWTWALSHDEGNARMLEENRHLESQPL